MLDLETLSDGERSIYAILTTGKANKINLCAAILQVLDDADEAERTNMLRFVSEHMERLESNDQVPFEAPPISDAEKESLRKKYGKLSDEMLNSLIAENPPESEFYKRLWSIINNPFFSEPNARAFVLYNVLMDSQIPYFCIDEGLRMANDDFKSLLNSLSEETARARFILKRHFDQKTQQASNLLKLLDQLEGNKRAVLMAYVLARAGNNQGGLLSMLKQAVED